MVLYALASNTQFFKVCSSGFDSIKMLNCSIETISDLCKETEIHIVVHPLVVQSDNKDSGTILDVIRCMKFEEADSIWDVFMVSGAHYRLIV